MIQKSHEKNVYRRIWQYLFFKLLPQQHQYDIIVSSGVFGVHVGFKMIDILLNSLHFLYVKFLLSEKHLKIKLLKKH